MSKRAKLAFTDTPRNLRDAVVTEARARWKAKHEEASEREVRLLRFIWMRDLVIEDRVRLHGGTLGSLMRKNMVVFLDKKILITRKGLNILDKDRSWRSPQ